jgi:hypothetical protein
MPGPRTEIQPTALLRLSQEQLEFVLFTSEYLLLLDRTARDSDWPHTVQVDLDSQDRARLGQLVRFLTKTRDETFGRPEGA